MKKIFLILVSSLFSILINAQIKPESDIDKSVALIQSQSNQLSIIGTSDSTLKFVNIDNERVIKYFFSADKICYKVELYYPNTPTVNMVAEFIKNGWTYNGVLKFNKGSFYMYIVERAANYPVATITKKL